MHRSDRFGIGADARRSPRVSLDAGAFACVMATGIVSVAADVQGLVVFSRLLLAAACAGWVVVVAAVSWRPSRLCCCRPRLQAFAVVAATAVLGARFLLAGENVLALALWILAIAVWVALVARMPTVGEPSGGSLLVVVATESLAVLAALLAPHWTAAFVVVALAGWALGLGLYPLVMEAIVRESRRRRRFSPDLWIVMGALAIATLAGAELLLAVRTMHALTELNHWLPDVDLAIWSLASALIAPLVASELRARGGWRYHPLRWSFVFPLGMYAVASRVLARADALTPLSWIGDAFFGVAVAAWALTAVGLARRSLRLGATGGPARDDWQESERTR